MYAKHVLTAGILAAALGLAPVATAQTSGSGSSSTSGTQTSSPSGQSGAQTGTTGSSQSSTSGSSQTTGGGGGDQEAVRQHLSAARQSLAELTKLPAAAQLQGEQRDQVANLISTFNAFATATTDWRSKYSVVDEALDRLLGTDSGSTSASASASTPASTESEASASTGSTAAGSTASTGSAASADPSGAASGTAVGTTGSASAAAGGDLDPSITAKLQEVRTHLDAFEEATGDPTFVVEKIEKILEQAGGGASASGSGSTAVGTSGSTGSTGASGSVTLDASQISEIRRHLESIRKAASR